MIRIIAFLGLYWGPLVLGNYHFEKGKLQSYLVEASTTRLKTNTLGPKPQF